MLGIRFPLPVVMGGVLVAPLLEKLAQQPAVQSTAPSASHGFNFNFGQHQSAPPAVQAPNPAPQQLPQQPPAQGLNLNHTPPTSGLQPRNYTPPRPTPTEQQTRAQHDLASTYGLPANHPFTASQINRQMNPQGLVQGFTTPLVANWMADRFLINPAMQRLGATRAGPAISRIGSQLGHGGVNTLWSLGADTLNQFDLPGINHLRGNIVGDTIGLDTAAPTYRSRTNDFNALARQPSLSRFGFSALNVAGQPVTTARTMIEDPLRDIGAADNSARRVYQMELARNPEPNISHDRDFSQLMQRRSQENPWSTFAQSGTGLGYMMNPDRAAEDYRLLHGSMLHNDRVHDWRGWAAQRQSQLAEQIPHAQPEQRNMLQQEQQRIAAQQQQTQANVNLVNNTQYNMRNRAMVSPLQALQGNWIAPWADPNTQSRGLRTLIGW